jgi:potassium-transporting ATPase KdpC subunit
MNTTVIRQIRSAFVAFALVTIITGVIYPLVITGLGQVLFPYQANGSLLVQDGQVVGSALIGQHTNDPRYFWSRPSSINYMQSTTSGVLTASGATSYSWTNSRLATQIAERTEAIRAANNLNENLLIPSDLLFASASGLDPHITPEGAALQVERVAAARGLELTQVEDLVAQYIEAPQLGVFGQPRVNVLLLNLALDSIE